MNPDHSPATTEDLRRELLATVAALDRRRADLVRESLIADYVARYWLEWNGGTLRLTETGQNVCKQMRAEVAAPDDPDGDGPAAPPPP